ncbi:MAG TPA: HAMP domain-containing sensor histidine kinase [Desulfobacteraceae bacterium]|nr:HAMP domain-containing sensor histidine kinase [Desulfobacteraceae bacterium]HPJ68062.1 HAMP domain-containing sensor histidine kinase [Desulfobacteraceae bacterium]HPQ28403.1 HAMP domain-containing sensor histidine kinase [Desulfobacteraceae bacterium]
MTVKTRIALFVAGAGFIASLLFSIVVFYELIEQPFDLLDTELEEEAYRSIKKIEMKETGSESMTLSKANYRTYPYWVRIYEPKFNRIVYQSNLAKLAHLPIVKPGSSAIASIIIPREKINLGQDRSQEVTFRLRTFLIPSEGRELTVQVGHPMIKLKEEIQELILGLVVGLVFSSLALIVISYFIAGRILKPIGSMKDLSRNISEKNLDQRLPVGNGHDEFNELARTINTMLDRLQYSFIRQRDFLFDTSHELKTPLTTMRLAIDEICTTDMETFPSFSKETLLRLNDQVLRMERLVKDLLNLSSLEMLNSIEAQQFDLTGLLLSLEADYRLFANAQNVQMDIKLPRQLILQGEIEKLNRAFSNLFDNAIKYNMKGGRVEVAGEQSDSDLTVTIANTGPGIAEAEIDKVFDQFYRVEQSRSIQHGGSGLGLAIAKRIIELHRGKIQLESEPGVWTKVTVSLPRSLENVHTGLST